MSSVGSATTSQPNGLAIRVTSVDSNRVAGRGSWLLSAGPAVARGGACLPGHGAQTIRSSSLSQLSVAGVPRAPLGKSSPTDWPAGKAPASGPALVISSSGAPPPRESQPMTNGLSRRAAERIAGRIAMKSCSAELARPGEVIARTRYQGPAPSPPRRAIVPTLRAYQSSGSRAASHGYATH